VNKILVIEDEDDVRTSIKDILENSDFKVITASDGITGVKLAKSKLPDLILCDIMMPGLDGYSVIKSLSKVERTSIIPFLFLSAKSTMEDLRLGMNLGADDYLVKPFRAKDLVEAINNRIMKRKQLLTKSKNNISDQNFDEVHNPFTPDRMFINYNNSMRLIKTKDIYCIRAEGSYTEIFTKAKKYTIRKSLKAWEELLPKEVFLRIHRSTIVNTNYFKYSEPVYNRSYHIYLDGMKEPLILSERYVKNLKHNSVIKTNKKTDLL